MEPLSKGLLDLPDLLDSPVLPEMLVLKVPRAREDLLELPETATRAQSREHPLDIRPDRANNKPIETSSFQFIVKEILLAYLVYGVPVQGAQSRIVPVFALHHSRPFESEFTKEFSLFNKKT